MSGLRVAVKVGASTLDRVRPSAPGVVVLIYHRVGGRTPVPVDLPTGLFEEQIAYLAEYAYVVPLADAVEVLTAGVRSEIPRVVVTFDDGTCDFAEEAVPILERYGVPATLYVSTAFVERGVPFPDDGRPLSWSALADTLSTGLVTVGSHTHTHTLLDRASIETIDVELDRSIELLQERLGVAAEHFAYPKAVPGSREADISVRARFLSAAVAGTRPNVYGEADVFALARSPVQVGDGMKWFRHKVAGGLRAEDTLRRLVNRGRYAGATT